MRIDQEHRQRVVDVESAVLDNPQITIVMCL